MSLRSTTGQPARQTPPGRAALYGGRPLAVVAEPRFAEPVGAEPIIGLLQVVARSVGSRFFSVSARSVRVASAIRAAGRRAAPMVHGAELGAPTVTAAELQQILRKPDRFGRWTTSVLADAVVRHVDSETLTVQLEVGEALSNSGGALHGGAIATLIDVLTSTALLVRDARPSVTVDLNEACISSAPVGSTITIESRVELVGHSMMFASCRLYVDEVDGGRRLVATGMHTKKAVRAAGQQPRAKL